MESDSEEDYDILLERSERLLFRFIFSGILLMLSMLCYSIYILK